MPMFTPHSSWEPPVKFPDLSGVKILGIDLETKDPSLNTKGPGSFRQDGHVVGVSIATDDRSWYFPTRHLGGGNMDPTATWEYLFDTLNVERTYVGANLQYELEWLSTKGITLPGDLIDIQIIEALIDEEQDTYELDALSKKYLGAGKDETLLQQAARDYGINAKSGLWQLHSKYVGPYAEFDAMAPLKILQKQRDEVHRQDLTEIVNLECPLTRILWLMRKQGVRIDLDQAKALSDSLKVKEDQLRYDIWKEHGCKIDEWSGDMLASICDRLKIHYPRTEKGNSSFEGEWLENHDNPFLRAVSSLRDINRLRDTFVNSWIFDNVVGDIIHPQWKQLKRDDGGTRTGRMAASNPNPQQVPSRSEIAPLIRKLFIPEDGMDWCKLDYSQQEPRLLVHFAYLCKMTGADLTRMAYRDNPNMDIYTFLAESAGISRRESKDITLGRCYGMGSRKLAVKLGISEMIAKKKLEEFDTSVPFVKEIADKCSQLAQQRGYIKTICGRRRHFNWYEPVNSYNMRQEGKDVRPRKIDAARAKWPDLRLQRANTHKSLNSLIQGSAADQAKAAMLQIYREHGKIPYLQVHDELNYGSESEGKSGELKGIAENCVKMEVPSRADMTHGRHWK